jgi:type IV pilus assembly protein PilP
MMRKLLPPLALAAIAACGDTSPPPGAPKPAAPKPAPAAAAEEPKIEAPQAIYVYTPIGKRDPFENVFAVREVTKVKMPGRKPTPLQKWPIDRLKLTMTMTGTSTPFAMIEDPEGLGHPVRVGDFIGQNWGKVTAIKRDTVVITESITDHATGRVYPNSITIKIPKTPAEEKADELLKEGQASATTGSR